MTPNTVSDSAIFKENSLYGYIEKYEFLIPTLSATSIGALTGAKIGGIYGAAIGGIVSGTLGVTDQILISYEFTSRHYLTSAVLGAGIMNSFQIPYYIGEAVGFATGMVAPTGYLTNLSGIVPTIMTTAITTQYAREKFPTVPHHTLYGAAAGLSVSLTDEALIYFNVATKHYLSTTAIVATTFDFISPKFNNIIGWGASFFKTTQTLHNSATTLVNNIPYASLGTGVILGSYIANDTELDVLNWKPISLGKNLLKTYERVLDKEVLENRIELFAITSVTNQLLFYNIMLKRYGAAQTIVGAVAKFGDVLTPDAKIAMWPPIRTNLLTFSFVILPPFILSHYTNNILQNYFSKQISYYIEDAINSEWLSNNTALKLSHSNSAITFIHHKTSDISLLAESGSLLIANAFSKTTGGIMATTFIVNNNAMDILLYSFLYNEISSEISKSIAKKVNEYPDSIRELAASKDNLEKDIANKAEIITERGGIKFHLDKLTKVNSQLRGLIEEKEKWDTIHDLWLTMKNVFNGIIFGYAAIAYKLSRGELTIDTQYKLINTIRKFFSLISFEMDNAADILQIEKANKSINQLIDSMRNDTSTTQHHHTEYQQGELSITFANLTITIEHGATLLHLGSLQFTEGIHAITGPKGSGKSSFTSQVIGLESQGIISKGTIIFSTPDGKPPIIVSVPQTDHIPGNVTLLELCYYPQLLPTDPDQLVSLSTTMREMWKQIGALNASETDADSLMQQLNEVKNWESILSGGQKKVVFIISAALQHSDILILDEPFSAFDYASVQKSQDWIKEFIAPGRIILSIDHTAIDNGFYNTKLLLKNQTFEVIDL